MSAILTDPKYRALLDDVLPAAIHSKKEHARLSKIAVRLMLKPDEEISREEGRLLELLGILIHDYETRTVPLPETAPRRMLAHMLAEKGLRPSDLWDILPKSRVSEILSDKRAI